MRIHDMAEYDRPQYRAGHVGVQAMGTAELLTLLAGASDTEVGERLSAELNAAGGVLNLTPAQLEQVKGIGPAKAAQICAAIELGRRAATPERATVTRIASPRDAAALLSPEMGHLEQESMRVILLDTRNQVKGISTIYTGTANTMLIDARDLFREAVRTGAVAIIIAHNHPSGNPEPSPEDVQETRRLVSAGELLDIRVLDHIIIGRGRFVSLKERGLGFDN